MITFKTSLSTRAFVCVHSFVIRLPSHPRAEEVWLSSMFVPRRCWPPVDASLTVDGVFYLSWMANTKLNCWARQVAITRLAAEDPRNRPGPLGLQHRRDANFLGSIFVASHACWAPKLAACSHVLASPTSSPHTLPCPSIFLGPATACNILATKTSSPLKKIWKTLH